MNLKTNDESIINALDSVGAMIEYAVKHFSYDELDTLQHFIADSPTMLNDEEDKDESYVKSPLPKINNLKRLK